LCHNDRQLSAAGFLCDPPTVTEISRSITKSRLFHKHYDSDTYNIGRRMIADRAVSRRKTVHAGFSHPFGTTKDLLAELRSGAPLHDQSWLHGYHVYSDGWCAIPYG
jgi:hypothetical protein